LDGKLKGDCLVHPSMKRRIILKEILDKWTMYRLDSTGSAQGPTVGFCEHGSELKSSQTISHVKNYQHFRVTS
jgi:hypothetical protein